MDKVSTFLADEALEGVLLAQKTYELQYEARMDELGSELEVEDDDEEEARRYKMNSCRRENQIERQDYAFSRLRVHYKRLGHVAKE